MTSECASETRVVNEFAKCYRVSDYVEDNRHRKKVRIFAMFQHIFDVPIRERQSLSISAPIQTVVMDQISDSSKEIQKSDLACQPFSRLR